MKLKLPLALLVVSMLAGHAAEAAPQTFRSKAVPGSMDEFSRVAVTRDCADTTSEPYIRCTRQDIAIADKNGKVIGKFPDAQIPRLPDGTYEVNLANVLVIDEDLGGGDGMRYFMWRFVPQDRNDQDVIGTGQLFPRYHEVVTDAALRPVENMRLAPGPTASKWLEAKRKESQRMVKAHQIENELRVDTYLELMADR